MTHFNNTGVDLVRLDAWMEQEDLGNGSLGSLRVIGGGTQNILLQFHRGEREFVLRRPPLHKRANSDKTNRREARMLAALAETDIPHPRLVRACADTSVIGASFYLMEPVDGFNARGSLPKPHSRDAAMQHRMGMALVEGIAQLSCVNYRAAGLEGFGKVDGFLERQADRWAQQLQSYSTFPKWPGPNSLGDIDTIRSWLEQHRPTHFVPGIVHGDYHISNVLYRTDSPELAAIVDWELTTIGAPLLDLGWLLATWPQSDGKQSPGVIGTAPWQGFPTADELVARYEVITGPTEWIEWYTVLACYKLAILLEGTYARALEGKAPMTTGKRLHQGAQNLIARAEEWMHQ